MMPVYRSRDKGDLMKKNDEKVKKIVFIDESGLFAKDVFKDSKTGKETKNRWMLKCGHPGEKAHKQYADFLFDEIVSLGYV